MQCELHYVTLIVCHVMLSLQRELHYVTLIVRHVTLSLQCESFSVESVVDWSPMLAPFSLHTCIHTYIHTYMLLNDGICILRRLRACICNALQYVSFAGEKLNILHFCNDSRSFLHENPHSSNPQNVSMKTYFQAISKSFLP